MSASDDAVRELMRRDPRVRCRDFLAELRAATESSFSAADDREWVRALWRDHKDDRRGTFRPDAHYLDPEKKVAYCYEVEDTNPLRVCKLWAIIDLANLVYEFYWDLEIIVVDTDLHERYRFNGLLPLFYGRDDLKDKAIARDYIRECLAKSEGKHPEILFAEAAAKTNGVDLVWEDRPAQTPP